MRDRFDSLLWLGLALSLGGVALLFLLGAPRGSEARDRSAVDRAMERAIAQRARAAFLQDLYGEVEALRAAGSGQAALLKLEELGRQYPGEAHGLILKGAILAESGALEEAVKNYVRGVRLDGDYIDAQSLLSRRTEIRRLVEEGLETLGARAKAHPDNRSVAASLRDVYYLQSRLAGGCE